MQQATPEPPCHTPPFSHVNDRKSSVGVGASCRWAAREGAGTQRGGGGDQQVTANVREAETRLEEERLVFSAVLEEGGWRTGD